LNRRIFSRINLQVFLLAMLGVSIAWLWFWLEQAQEEGGYPIYQVAVLWVLVLVFCLWLGNWVIYCIIRRNFPWETAFNRRFFLQLSLTLLYSLGCINGTYLYFKNTFTELPPDHDQLILLNIYGTLFLIPVLSIQFGLLFLQKWKKATIEQERLQKEQVQSELLALRSHISPHFLFNNLNVLSSLIDGKNYDAQDYLDRFAEVYRYVLKNRDLELINLQEELDFLDAYSFLLKRRFSSGLQIEIDVPVVLRKHHLPPLSLQMLLENALKHNKLSEQEPLQINITADERPALVVQNNLQLRSIPSHERSGFGLENIRRRYWLIAREKIDVQATEKAFVVTIPLIAQAN